MQSVNNCILTINGGSSGIKFSLYSIAVPLNLVMHGEIKNIASKNSSLQFTYVPGVVKSFPLTAGDLGDAADILVDWLEKENAFSYLKAIGHRIVHGMQHAKPELVTESLMDELKKISAYDPEHLPGEIKLIEIIGKRYPAIMQVACFDTSFHTSMPKVAKLLTIPRSYYEKGIQRYGFHGLSYAYLLEELERIAGSEAALGKIVIAHLGNGASVTAIVDGRSVDTSMGFTPASGLPMSTRTGDLDPGVALYFMQQEKMSPEAFNLLINHQSGLLGLSGTSSDMRELINIKDTDKHAGEAIDLFCYQAKKWIGSFAAVLGGIDTLVFSGGIGENAPEIRERICAGLGFLDIQLDKNSNHNNEPVISSAEKRVTVRVIRTNEELMIAKLVYSVLNQIIKN